MHESRYDIQRNRRAAGARRGAILAFVLASLLVASLLGLALVQTVLLHHRRMQTVSQRQQSFWLAEAGVQRAVRRLAESPDYRGEKWAVPAEVLGSTHLGMVIIEVTKADGSPATPEIHVEARFPDDPIRRTIYRRSMTVDAGQRRNAKPNPKH